MAVKPGYKQTKVGVIPEEWEAKQIRDVCTLVNGRGFKPHEWKTTGLPIIRIQNLNGSDDFNFYSGQYNPKILIEPGQLLFAWSGSRGTSFGPHVWGGSRALLNYHTWKVVTNDSTADADYLLHALRQLTRFIEDRAHGASALVHTQKWEMEKFPIPVPSNHLEQRAIATALSDVDALLGALERLIAKKRDLKQASMQQLLTGQTRLPGFQDDWEVKRLGDCLISRPDYGINAAAVPFSDKLPSYIRITDISVHGRFCPDPRVSVRAASAAQYYLQTGDVVFARTGASVGKSYLYEPGDGPLVFAGFLIRVRPNPSLLVPAFLAAYTTTQPYWNWVRLMSMRSGQPGINGNEYAQLPLSLPTLPEQTAIAAVLTDMDAELAALEQRLAKTRALKQGMMQELLTGRTRLL